MEEISETNGLKNILNQILISKNIKSKIYNFCLKDEFIYNHGSQSDILKMNKLEKNLIYKKIKNLLKKI